MRLPATTPAWLLKCYARGLPGADTFELAKTPLAAPGEGELAVRTLYLGMDPFPRLRIGGDASRAPQLALGEIMLGRGVGEVVASRSALWREGDIVAGELGWRAFAVVKEGEVTRVDPALGPVRYALGVMGPSGLAAWCSTVVLGQASGEDVVFVTAAAGAVGSLAAQIARLQGARVIGAARGAQLDFLRRELGLDEALDYSAPDFAARLAAAAPSGLNLTLDLVGGPLFDAAIANLAVGARVVLVGAISDYNDAAAAYGPRPNYQIIVKRARVLGFLVADYADRYGEARAAISGWLAEGKLIVKETIHEGLERAPEAFAALFGADVVGKQIVRVSAEREWKNS